MSRIDNLLVAYERRVSAPWAKSVAGPERVWFCLHDPKDERALLFSLGNFEIATTSAGHGWRSHDISNTFGNWLAQHDYRNAYFEHPELFADAAGEFLEELTGTLKSWMQAEDENTVVVLAGISSLFGIARVSKLVEETAPHVRGRLLVFFPGHRHESNYRLLDARDGWNYLAIPIEAEVSKS